MIKFAILASLLFTSSACAPQKPIAPDEREMSDYVLIEFAAKLEEDYHRFHDDSHPTEPSNDSSIPQKPAGHP